MKWQVAKLLKTSTKEVIIDEEIDLTDAVKKNPDIKNVTNILVTGKGFVDATKRKMTFDLTIKGQMTLACALTLDDVIYPFEASLSPVFIWDVDQYDEESEDYLIRDTIELAPTIWQEILIQIPLRVVKAGAYDELARQGIEILTEEALKEEAKTQMDPRFSVLEGLKFEK